MNLTADGAADTLPIPDHLHGRDVVRGSISGAYYIICPPGHFIHDCQGAGKIEDLWLLLTPEQQAAVIMASITKVVCDSDEPDGVEAFDVTDTITAYSDGDVRVKLPPPEVNNELNS